MPSFALRSLVSAACRRPLPVLLVAIATMAAALVYISGHIAMNSDASSLISASAQWRAAEIRMDRAFPGNGDVILVVIDGTTPEAAEGAATALTAALAGDRTHFASVTRPDGGDFFGREGLLYLPAGDVRATTARMVEAQPFLGPLAADPSLRGIATALGTMLEGVTRGEATLDRIGKPIAGLADALERQAAGSPAAFSWQALIAGDASGMTTQTRRLILIRPKLDLTSLMPGAEASDAVRAHAARLKLDSSHGVSVRLTGATPLSDEEFGSLADKWWLVAGSMVLAMLLTLRLATRSGRLTAAILLTTLAGLIVTTALGLAVVGPLNLISVAFIPLFVGLGVDFGIQLAVRFQSERASGLAPGEAFADAAGALGPSLLLAAGAICLGLLAFLPTSYRGIAELGVIAAIGMVIALFASVTLLPALVMLMPPSRPRAEMGSTALAPLDHWLMRRRKAVLWAFALSMLVSIALLPLVRFDFDPLHLRPADSEAMTTLKALMIDPDRNPNTADMLAADLPAARKLATRLGASPNVERVMTIESFVPDDQPAKLGAIGDAKMLLDLTLDPIAPLPSPSDSDIAGALRDVAAKLAAARGDPKSAAATRRLAVRFDRLAKGSSADRANAIALFVPPLQTMLGQLRLSLQAGPVSPDR